jgi:DnaA family protein
MEQLPLGVRLRAASTFASFSAGDNAALVAALSARARQPRLAPLWLWAAPGAGRSHLLQATCALAGQHTRRAALLPFGAPWLDQAMLPGLETLHVVCLDDVDRVTGNAEWERVLFALYNELAERGGNLVVSAAAAPAAIPVGLPDLRSRFAASEVWQLRALPEAEHGAALRGRARDLGIELPDETLQYLQRRLPRDLGALCAALERLDAASLSMQRRLTVPFVRSVLGLADD